MAYKQNKTKQNKIDQIRHEAGAAILARLNNQPLAEITHGDLSQDTGHDVALLRRIFPDLSMAIDQGLQDIDDAIALKLAEDLKEDETASMRERILEGLIIRHETYTPLKNAIKNLNKGALKNPPFGVIMAGRLSASMASLLAVCGDDTSGLKGMLRIKGLAGVCLSVQRDWLGDETTDLSITIRALDKRLAQAEDLARLLTVIPKEAKPTQQGDEDHDN